MSAIRVVSPVATAIGVVAGWGMSVAIFGWHPLQLSLLAFNLVAFTGVALAVNAIYRRRYRTHD